MENTYYANVATAAEAALARAEKAAEKLDNGDEDMDETAAEILTAAAAAGKEAARFIGAGGAIYDSEYRRAATAAAAAYRLAANAANLLSNGYAEEAANV